MTQQNIESESKQALERINQAINTAEQLKTDAEKEQRLAAQQCRCCYYLRKVRIGGAAMTERPCGSCDTPMFFSSTATDVLCPECAQKQSLCKQCGARIDI
jgi:hypothetical protein